MYLEFTKKVQQYSQRHSMINHCDRHITPLWYWYICWSAYSIYLFWYAFWVIVSIALIVKEILKIYLIEHKIYPYHQDERYVYHGDLSCYVSDCTVPESQRTIIRNLPIPCDQNYPLGFRLTLSTLIFSAYPNVVIAIVGQMLLKTRSLSCIT